MANKQMKKGSGDQAPIGASSGLSDSLLGKLGELLSKAITDAAVLEVRTFTSDAEDSALAGSGDPLETNTRLRAFTRVAIDGDTQVCVPIGKNGEPDEVMWKLHCESVAQARADRAATIESTIALIKELVGR